MRTSITPDTDSFYAVCYIIHFQNWKGFSDLVAMIFKFKKWSITFADAV